MDDMETRLRYEFNIEIQKLKKRIEVLEAKPKRKKFVKPTAAQVADYMRAYCHEKGIQTNVDPERFVGWYESNGWMAGRNKMQSWESTVENWIRNDKNKDKPLRKQSAYVDDMHTRTEKTRAENLPPADVVHSLFDDD